MTLSVLDINEKNLRILSNLVLKTECGMLCRDTHTDLHELDAFISSKVGVRVDLDYQIDAINPELFDAFRFLGGVHESFIYLRNKIQQQCDMPNSKVAGFFERRHMPPVRIITPLYDGIFVGTPFDLMNLRRDTGLEPVNYVEGFGKKLADIYFID